jgi:rSAM/selenodomain-associated transferase 2
VIIPVYKEESRIRRTIAALLELKKKDDDCTEIIVVDGEDAGSTINCIEAPGIIKLIARKGRAFQMNKGAEIARGDILLFLHADSRLPENGFSRIKETIAPGTYVAGAFNYSTQSLNFFMKHIYWTSYLRSRIFRIAYGDQGIFIRKDYFRKLGGYPEIPLLEDVELFKRIKKNKDRIRILEAKVKSSTRRYDEEGQVFVWFRNNMIRILHFLGVSPEKLAKCYPDTRRKRRNSE